MVHDGFCLHLFVIREEKKKRKFYIMHFTEISLVLCLLSIFSSVYTINGIQERHERELLKIIKMDEKFEESEIMDFDDQEIDFPNINETLYDNSPVLINNTNPSNESVQLSCIRNKTLVPQPVEIVNSTRLVSLLQSESNVTSKQTPGTCLAVLFYSPICPFSCKAAPHFNALAQFFPDIKMVALDAMTYKNFNAQYGIFGLPSFILYHNGKPAARLNDTSDYNLEMFAKFIKGCTNITPNGKLVVTSSDFKGPISAVPANEKDYYLILSWIVIALQLLYSFYCSSWGRWLVDITLSAWREAEAQYHHID